MTSITVGDGGDFKTIGAAIAAAKPGDTVRVSAGVYREAGRITTANLTLIGEPGAIIDGGYNHEWAKTSGTSWRDLKYKAPPAGSRDMIIVAADGVTVEGLRIQNAPASGVAAGAVSGLTVRNCEFDHLYGTGILVNGTTGTARNILIDGNYVNAASVRIFDDSREFFDPQGVTGSIKVGNAEGVTIRGNTVINGFGEGINQGKNLKIFTVEGNTVIDCNHKHYYCNSAVDGVIRDNVALFTGHPAHLWVRGRSPAGFAINDETNRKPYSANLTWEGNVAINMGVPLQIIPYGSSDGRMTVRNNTFVWGPLTRDGAQVKGGTVTVEGNIFAVTSGGSMPTGAVKPGPNLWTVKPPKGWSHAGDVIADPQFVNPTLPGGPHDAYGIIDNVTATLDLNGYGLQPTSPALRDGVVVFGATAELVDPPVDPEPEPPALDAAAIREQAAVIRMALDEIEQLLGDGEPGDA